MPTPHVPGDPMAASHSGRPPAVRSGRAAAPAAAAPPGQPPAAHPQPAPAVPQTCTLVPTLPPSQPVLRARDHNPSRTSSELLQNPGSAEKDSQALSPPASLPRRLTFFLSLVQQMTLSRTRV